MSCPASSQNPSVSASPALGFQVHPTVLASHMGARDSQTGYGEACGSTEGMVTKRGMVSLGGVDVVTKAGAPVSWILSFALKSCLWLAESETNAQKPGAWRRNRKPGEVGILLGNDR